MTDLDAIGKAVDIALAATRGKIKDPTGGALHYFAHRKARPNWAKGGWGFILGDHTFVKLTGRSLGQEKASCAQVQEEALSPQWRSSATGSGEW